LKFAFGCDFQIALRWPYPGGNGRDKRGLFLAIQILCTLNCAPEIKFSKCVVPLEGWIASESRLRDDFIDKKKQKTEAD